MNFLVDAHLPRSLALLLVSKGHDALHTLDLPAKNRTPDNVLCQIARDTQRVLITKDEDFVDSFFLGKLPPKLLLVTTGNISNRALLDLFQLNMAEITVALSSHSFVQIDFHGLTIHE